MSIQRTKQIVFMKHMRCIPYIYIPYQHEKRCIRVKTARLLCVVLAIGILAMFILYAENNRAHPLMLMERVELPDAEATQRLDLSEVQPDRQINVAVDGAIVPMGLEDYVYCVLAGEMPASFEPEALKAQAVAARTLAVYKVMHGGCSKYRGADICDQSDHCQAFSSEEEQKAKWKGNYDKYSAKLHEAVSQTAGKIITYDDAPILVLYHSSSAGYTEDVENVYSKALPYLRSVPSPGDAEVTELESVEEFDRKWFCDTVNKAYSKAKLSQTTLEKQVSVASRFPSGRVEMIKLGGVSISGTAFRGLMDIRSANFTVTFNQYSVIVTTEGFGHGVGMSQYGANAMALEGSGYEEILRYYYTGVEIINME